MKVGFKMIGNSLYKNFFAVIFLVLFIQGCTNKIDVEQYEVNNPIAEQTQDDFIFRLISEKEQYEEKEEVILYGEIEYIGEENEIEIVHSSSPIFFNIIEEERQYAVEDIVQDIGVTTVLKQNEPLRIVYEKNAFYDETDPKNYIDFVEQLVEQEGFPIGYYTVTGITNFSVFKNKDENPTPYDMEATIDFKVSE